MITRRSVLNKDNQSVNQSINQSIAALYIGGKECDFCQLDPAMQHCNNNIREHRHRLCD